MEMFQIRDLIENGQFNKASVKIDNLGPVNQLEGKILKCRIFRRTGKDELALVSANEGLQDSITLGKKPQELAARVEKSWGLWEFGRYNEALEVVHLGEKLLEDMNSEQRKKLLDWEVDLSYVKGRIYQHLISKQDQALDQFSKILTLGGDENNLRAKAFGFYGIAKEYWYKKGDLARARDYFFKSLTVFTELNYKIFIGKNLYFIAVLYFDKEGDLLEALKYCQQSKDIFQEIGFKLGISQSYILFGEIYRSKGKLDRALDHLKKSLTMREELKKKRKIAQTHYFMGKVYADMDQLKQATVSYQKCLSILIEFNEYHRTSYTLLHLILIFLEMNIDQNVSRYFQQLEDLSQKSGNRIINLHYKLGKAIILKSSRRAKYKIESQLILEKIVEEEIVDLALTAYAILNLCELLLDEYKTYGEQEVWQEIEELSNRIHSFAMAQNSYPLIVNALLLKAKLVLITGKISNSNKIMEEAYTIANERGLSKIRQKVKIEQQTLETELEWYENAVIESSSMLKRIKHSEIEVYLAEVIKSMGRG